MPVYVFSLLKAEDSERFKTMVQFECRGLEPVDFQPQVRYFTYSSSVYMYHRSKGWGHCLKKKRNDHFYSARINQIDQK